MPEEFLHFIWRFQLFDHTILQSPRGSVIQVLNPGFLNHNSGPDFTEARLLIDNTQWIGNVEIHVNTSDWFKHNHQFDPAYDNVILHVVYSHDDLRWNEKSKGIPILELKNRIDLSRFHVWKKLQKSREWIPCQKGLANVPSIYKNQMIHLAAISRLERKVLEFESILNETNGHWERALMQTLLRSYGTKVNKEAFSILARLLPFPILKKNLHNSLLISAIVYGIAGFLEDDFQDSYPNELKLEFKFLKLKYTFPIMNYSIWKFLRMRPANFPSLRLAQFIELLNSWNEFIEMLFYDLDLSRLEEFLRRAPQNYWKNHYRFDTKSSLRSTRMGKSTVNLILINSIVPFLYSYGDKHGDIKKKELAISILEKLQAEENTLIKKWRKLGLDPKNSLETQGLIELKNTFCSFKKCLSCKIGVWIINPLKDDKENTRLF